MKTLNNLSWLLLTTTLFLLGCTSNLQHNKDRTTYDDVAITPSYLEGGKATKAPENQAETTAEGSGGDFNRLNNERLDESGLKFEFDLSTQFTGEKIHQVSVNALPLNDFLHYVLGDLLNISYLIAPTVKANTTPVTLELRDKVSGKRLFQLVQQLLGQNNITIALNDEVFFCAFTCGR
jgi:general secretion pathway protein D